MTTLMEIRDGSGLVGRCDAKCYLATDKNCMCICGGANHGVGLEQAKENIRTDGEQMIIEITSLNGLADYEVMVNYTVVNQLALPLELPDTYGYIDYDNDPEWKLDREIKLPELKDPV